MTFFDAPLYLVRLAFYWLRLVLFFCYHVLIAISKPGSVLLGFAILVGLFWWQRERIPYTSFYHWWVNDIVQYYTPHYPVDQPYWYMGLFVAVVTFCHYILVGGKFKLLASILGVFPQIRRPLPPAMPLRIKEQKIIPASVTLAVPKLKRSRRLRREPDFIANLSEPLQKLLEPPEKPVEKQEAPKPAEEPPEASSPPAPSPQEPPEAQVTPPERGRYIPPKKPA